MFIAVIAAVTVMLLASGPLARFINDNPTVVMLALGFLLMIGMVLIADGFGIHVPKGYVYAAMAFSAFVEILNLDVAQEEAKADGAAAARRTRRERAVVRRAYRFRATGVSQLRAAYFRRRERMLTCGHTTTAQKRRAFPFIADGGGLP